jgi:hypothetical protein
MTCEQYFEIVNIVLPVMGLFCAGMWAGYAIAKRTSQ